MIILVLNIIYNNKIGDFPHSKQFDKYLFVVCSPNSLHCGYNISSFLPKVKELFILSCVYKYLKANIFLQYKMIKNIIINNNNKKKQDFRKT